MRTFRHKNIVPPGGFFFFHVENTDAYFEDKQFDRLLQRLRAHFKANDLAVPKNLEEEVVNYICLNVPESFCVGPKDYRQAKFYSLSQLRDYTKIVAGIGLSAVRGVREESFVSQEEADSRAEICETCPLNNRRLCSTCNGLLGFSQLLIGRSRKTSRDLVLGTCEKCGCLLRVKVHLEKALLRKTTQHNYPEHCWLSPVKENSHGRAESRFVAEHH